MMHTMNYDSGMDTLGGLHVLGMLALFVGIIFLITWALKTLTVPQLRMWGIGLFVIGLVFCLLSLIVSPTTRQFTMSTSNNGMPFSFHAIRIMNTDNQDPTGQAQGTNMMFNGMTNIAPQDPQVDSYPTDTSMQNMMQGSTTTSASPMSMSMDDMAAMLRGKTGDAFDQAFIEGMIPHHQGAIDMARAALKSAGHPELKELARQIITAQQKEIVMMQQWMKDWGYTQQ